MACQRHPRGTGFLAMPSVWRWTPVTPQQAMIPSGECEENAFITRRVKLSKWIKVSRRIHTLMTDTDVYSYNYILMILFSSNRKKTAISNIWYLQLWHCAAVMRITLLRNIRFLSPRFPFVLCPVAASVEPRETEHLLDDCLSYLWRELSVQSFDRVGTLLPLCHGETWELESQTTIWYTRNQGYKYHFALSGFTGVSITHGDDR